MRPKISHSAHFTRLGHNAWKLCLLIRVVFKQKPRAMPGSASGKIKIFLNILILCICLTAQVRKEVLSRILFVMWMNLLLVWALILSVHFFVTHYKSTIEVCASECENQGADHIDDSKGEETHQLRKYPSFTVSSKEPKIGYFATKQKLVATLTMFAWIYVCYINPCDQYIQHVLFLV